MSEKCLLDQWRDMAYDRNLSKRAVREFLGKKYFTIETSIYEQLLMILRGKRNSERTCRKIRSGCNDDGWFS